MSKLNKRKNQPCHICGDPVKWGPHCIKCKKLTCPDCGKSDWDESNLVTYASKHWWCIECWAAEKVLEALSK